MEIEGSQDGVKLQEVIDGLVERLPLQLPLSEGKTFHTRVAHPLTPKNYHINGSSIATMMKLRTGFSETLML